jgi:hypothetical protein
VPRRIVKESKMTILHSHQARIRNRTGDAYRAYLISRSPPPFLYHSGAMHLKRLRVFARKISRSVGAALEFIHNAIIAAKIRRVQRELMVHDEWFRFGSKWHEEHDLEKDVSGFPQRPLILGDKWDS